jgi:hypothetical protein
MSDRYRGGAMSDRYRGGAMSDRYRGGAMSDRYASKENRCMLDATEERMPTGEERIERACMERI